MAKYKVYVIDADKQEIREDTCNGKLADIYKLIGNDCTEFTTICINGQRDMIYIDAEGLNKARRSHPHLQIQLFSHARYHSTLIGNGVLIGHDEDGDSQEPFYTIDQLRKEITFFPTKQ